MTEQSILCPVCNVPLRAQSTICSDCGEDLAPIVYLQQEAVLLYNRGLTCAQAGELAQAISLLERSLEADNSRAPTFTLLAKLYLKQERLAEATLAWERALELEPDNQDIRDAQAYLDQLARREAALVKADAGHDSQRQEETRRRATLRWGLRMSLAFVAGIIAFLGVQWLWGELVKPPEGPPTGTAVPALAAGLQASETPSAAATTPVVVPREPSPTAMPTQTTEASSTAAPTQVATASPPPTSTAIPTPVATIPPTPIPDLVTPVRQALTRVGQAAASLEVRQMGSLVILQGAVPSLLERYRIENVVRSVPGVAAVDLVDLKVAATYRIRSGDTLYGIARAVYGDASHWPLLAQANGLQPPYLIITGQDLKVPLP